MYTYEYCNICKLKYEYEDKLYESTFVYTKVDMICCLFRYSTRTRILSSFITTYLRRYYFRTFVPSYLRRYYVFSKIRVRKYNSILSSYSRATCTRTINNARCRLVVVHVALRVAFSTLTVFRRDGGRRRGQRRRGTLSHNHNGHG